MKLSNELKRKIRQVIYITIFWWFVAFFFVIHDHLFKESLKGSIFKDYNFWTNLITNLFAVATAGVTGGSIIVFFLKDRFKRRPLWFGIVVNTITFILLISVVTIFASLFYNALVTDLPFSHPEVRSRTIEFYTGPGYLMVLVNWTIISSLTLVVLQINDKYGQGIFLDLLKGKYHKPKEETRIFMFLDMQGSTSIAERIGNKKYFQLLNEFFEDCTKAIVETKGEIYQYVGDEIVISWKIKNGTKDANCLKCFFEIKNNIQQLSDKYLKRFGVVPEFKAGLHYGQITVGEVGTIKKDIIFSGDVLNTTSRMRDLCNAFEVKLLVSEDMLRLLDLKDGFQTKEIGEIQLKGKNVPIRLFNVFIGVKTAVAEKGTVKT
ncbi:adenylate/guanylate cyclase domain-containing protein [Fulvivirgaceae bacterium BMA10]|uniref:Adenylate/guanylate cyclase domain-containing protein n=1 Tax=Splendidivirga corallicola TaxID=3051826 RepID=A0ABT8KL51_9BACT|nr:adenylate/guanylate cyclase domain-containing protein [Fulvivirgaceae bacterium BMA10]